MKRYAKAYAMVLKYGLSCTLAKELEEALFNVLQANKAETLTSGGYDDQG